MVLVSLLPGIIVNFKKKHTQRCFVQWVQKDTFNLHAVIGGFFFFVIYFVFLYMFYMFFHIIMIPSGKIPSQYLAGFRL